MSDIFDHDADAWDQLLFHEECVEESPMTSLHQQRWGRFPPKDYWEEERKQPEYQDLHVTKLHAETEKSYCVSGTVYFEVPYRGMKTFEFISYWLPKSQCIFTGTNARIPQWLVRSRYQQREKFKRKFNGLNKKIEALLNCNPV